MRSSPNDKYIYCTPFLKEIDRIRAACGEKRFRTPTNYTSTKIEDFNRLLSSDSSIAVTHTTFLNATQETIQAIHDEDFTLILDETLDLVKDFNQTQSVENSPRQSLTADDITWLIDQRIISVGDDYKVTWTANSSGEDSKLSEVQRLAKLGRLFYVRHSLMVAVYPPEIFREFKHVYVLTYMFSGNILNAYFDYFGLPYEMASVYQMPDNSYQIGVYSKQSDIDFRRKCKELIHVCHDKSRNIGFALTKNWYRHAPKEKLLQLKLQIKNYVQCITRQQKATSSAVMWTTFESYESALKGKGYTCTIDPETNEKISCFVPCNARATNDYQDRFILAYMIDMRMNQMIRGFFVDGNEARKAHNRPTVELNEDVFSLSNLIQWIFRSRIRTGQPIWIYIPSRHMRTLLVDWLNV
jgi:hypothetical protein